jgi:hypothetical protein
MSGRKGRGYRTQVARQRAEAKREGALERAEAKRARKAKREESE